MKKTTPIPADAPRIVVYQTKSYSFDIVEREALKFSDKTITIVEPATRWNPETSHRYDRHSTYGDFWLTREAAVQDLIHRAEGKIRAAETSITHCEKALEGLLRMAMKTNPIT
jgi:hypothetical protein